MLEPMSFRVALVLHIILVPWCDEERLHECWKLGRALAIKRGVGCCNLIPECGDFRRG